MEDGPEYPTKPITAHVIRKQLYWATFAGGLHTYGNSNIWSFGTNPKYVSQDWKTALDSPGAQHLTISRQFFELSNGGASSPINRFSARVAAAEKLNVAMRSSSGDAIIVYVSSNTTVTVDLSRITQSNTLTAARVDPRTGNKLDIGRIQNMSTRDFSTPARWEDGLLLIQAVE